MESLVGPWQDAAMIQFTAMSDTRPSVRRAAFLAALACATSATAQEAAAPSASAASDADQVVEVKQVRNPGMMRYRVASDLVSKVGEAGKGHLHAVIRVTAAKTHDPAPDLRVVIDGEHTHLPVGISPNGFVTLPIDPAAYADDADLVSNKPKSALDVGIFVVPDLPATDPHLDDIAAATSVAQSAISAILPWYLRMLSPSIKGVQFCYLDEHQSVAIAGKPDTPRAATEPDKDVMGRQVFCARFTGAEAAAGKGRLLTPAPGWQALFW